MVNVHDLFVMKSYASGEENPSPGNGSEFSNSCQLSLFWQLCLIVEDNLLGTYWGCAFPVGLVFFFVFEVVCDASEHYHSSAVAFPPKGDGCFFSCLFSHTIQCVQDRSVTWKGLPG